MMQKQHVKIYFRLPSDTDGYPPVSVESVWAKKAIGPNQYTLDNVPFFARTATEGDLVAASESEGRLWFDKIIEKSGNSLIRIVLFDVSRCSEVRKQLLDWGCCSEWSEAHNLIAVNVPPKTELAEVQRYLQEQSKHGYLDYEEPILRQSNGS